MSASKLAVAIALVFGSGTALAEPIYVYKVSTNRLVGFDASRTSVHTTDVVVSGIGAGEALAGIDFRPQNGQLYGLGINASANTGTVYAISPRTGVATAVGTAGSVAFVDIGGTPIDFPDVITPGYGFDFNPLVDRIRVTAGSLNFRVDPNNGAPVDLDANGANGINPDGAMNGGTTNVTAAAYTNNGPNTTATTLYTLDDISNGLFIQSPPNNGTQTLQQIVTLSGPTLDFASVNGFDIPSGVNVGTSNAAVTAGFAYAGLSVGGFNRLYRIDLPTAAATQLGVIDSGLTPVLGLAAQPNAPRPLIGLGGGGINLVRLNLSTPGTTTTVAITNVAIGEVLVGIDVRPQTGQVMALGVNAIANTGTLYLLDPQTGVATAIGTPGQVAFVDAALNPVDLPDPVTVGYGFDFNPTVDRVRVTTDTGLNFRLNPNNGAPVDGDGGNPMTQPDAAIQGSGSTGVVGAAYTNSFGQSLTGGVTTLYTLDATQNTLQIQNPANAGVQVLPLVITENGAPLDFTAVGGFDIPPDVSVSTSAAPAVGQGIAVLTVGGTPALFLIDLSTAQARRIGALPGPLSGITAADALERVFADGYE